MLKVEQRAAAMLALPCRQCLPLARRVRRRASVVHCAFGQSRSVTVVVAHLVISNRGLSLGEALERMRSLGHRVPEPSFLEQLVRLELRTPRRRPLKPPTEPMSPAFPPRGRSSRGATRSAGRTDSVSCHGPSSVAPASRHPRVAVISNFLTRAWQPPISSRPHAPKGPPVARRSTSTDVMSGWDDSS